MQQTMPRTCWRIPSVEQAQSNSNRRTQHRTLDDEDLDSGDDEGRQDRTGYEEGEEGGEYMQVEEAILDVDLGRQPLPEPSDGEVRSIA